MPEFADRRIAKTGFHVRCAAYYVRHEHRRVLSWVDRLMVAPSNHVLLAFDLMMIDLVKVDLAMIDLPESKLTHHVQDVAPGLVTQWVPDRMM